MKLQMRYLGRSSRARKAGEGVVFRNALNTSKRQRGNKTEKTPLDLVQGVRVEGYDGCSSSNTDLNGQVRQVT